MKLNIRLTSCFLHKFTITNFKYQVQCSVFWEIHSPRNRFWNELLSQQCSFTRVLLETFVYIDLSSQFYSAQLEISSTNENIRKRNSLISLVNFYSVLFSSTISAYNFLKQFCQKFAKKAVSSIFSKISGFLESGSA